jgi:hypothetical protein
LKEATVSFSQRSHNVLTRKRRLGEPLADHEVFSPSFTAQTGEVGVVGEEELKLEFCQSQNPDAFLHFGVDKLRRAAPMLPLPADPGLR